MKRLNTIARKQVTEDVRDLLNKAEQEKATSYPEAIKKLYKAAEYLPGLAVDNDRKSDRNITQNRNTQEILYMSKRGNILYELKDFEEAKKCYEFIKQKLPNNTEVHKALGDCHRKLKNFQEAGALYDRGLVVYEKDDAVAPNVKSGLLNSRGLNYMEQGKYAKAKEDFEAVVKMTAKNPNPLYLCNKGYAIYALNEKGQGKDEALKSFKEANELIKSGQTTGLTGQNIEYIKKTLEEFLEGLEDLKSVDLPKQDVGMELRELLYIKSNLDAIAGTEEVDQSEKSTVEETDQEQGEEEKRKALFIKMAQTISKLKNIKLDIQKIQNDTRLFEYYDGFLFALAQSYKTAVIINSGQVLYDVSTGTEIDILTSAIKLVPLVGPQLSDGVQSLAKYAKNTQVTKAAANICKFATTEGMFVEIAQDALLALIKAKRSKIQEQQDVDLDKIILPKWASSYQKVVDKIIKLNGQVNEILYGERNETPLQKLGYQTANTLISRHVATGALYNGEIAVRIPTDEKKKRLTLAAKDLFEKSVDPNQVPELSTETVEAPHGGICDNCRMF